MPKEIYECKRCAELRKTLADLQKEYENAIGLKNTYHDNWQELKTTVDSQAEVINNLTVRWGKVCREIADLKALVKKYRRCLFKPYNPQEIDNEEFYEYDEKIQQAIKEDK